MTSTKTATLTRKEVVKKHRKSLDKLSTREAQVLRMRFGVSEPGSAKVGRPSSNLSSEQIEEVDELEAEVMDKLHPEESGSTKKKIIEVLKKRS